MNSKSKNIIMLSIRDFNVTQLSACQPKSNCSMSCNPGCSSTQVDNTQLQISATDLNAMNENRKTTLIAGLTTCIVVLTLIAATIAVFVFYRRWKTQKLLAQHKYFPSQPDTPIIIIPPPEMALLPPISESSLDNHHWNNQAVSGEYVNYNHPQSPFIISAQSLQIPHLDDTPDPSTPPLPRTIRRSLNIQQQTPLLINNLLGRASSVKVTKYDHQQIHIPMEEDLEEKVTIRRAVSVKKNNSTASHSSSITRVGSISSMCCAKPTMIRINTIMKKDEDGITRKALIRTVIDQSTSSFSASLQDPPPPFNVSLQDPPPPSSTNSISSATNESGRIDFYLCPPPISSSSIQSSASSQSTLGDGSITVFWEPPE